MQCGQAEGRTASGSETSFDFSSYYSSYYNGVDYSAVYNKDYYLNQYSDLRAVFGNNPSALIAHFVNYGMAEGRRGNSTFNGASYITTILTYVVYMAII
jgi:hypothetical protein